MEQIGDVRREKTFIQKGEDITIKSFYTDIELYILRMLGHPMRLLIVRELIAKSPLHVSELQKLPDAPQSTVSQQLTQLKYFKLVFYDRKGNEVYYYSK